jgi:hypothetical protein
MLPVKQDSAARDENVSFLVFSLSLGGDARESSVVSRRLERERTD